MLIAPGSRGHPHTATASHLIVLDTAHTTTRRVNWVDGPDPHHPHALLPLR